MKPTFPLLYAYAEYLDVIPEESFLHKTTVRSILYKESNIVYDSAGQRWTYEQRSDSIKDNFLTRLLANTFYNPMVEVETIWTNMGAYALEELQTKINRCIDNDDVLTQFVEPDVFKKEITEAKSFQEILHLLNKYVYEPEAHGIESELN